MRTNSFAANFATKFGYWANFGVIALDQTTCKDASALIDDLKLRIATAANGGPS